ncbi:hypothetical protein HDU67_010321, partial [Dinochytrium kinnereticum]
MLSSYLSSPGNAAAGVPTELPKQSSSPLGMLAIDLDETLNVSDSSCTRRRLFLDDAPPNPFLFQAKPKRSFTRVATCSARIERSSQALPPPPPSVLCRDDVSDDEQLSLGPDDASMFDFHLLPPTHPFATSLQSGIKTTARPPLAPTTTSEPKRNGGTLHWATTSDPKLKVGPLHWNQRGKTSGRTTTTPGEGTPRSVLDMSSLTDPPPSSHHPHRSLSETSTRDPSCTLGTKKRDRPHPLLCGAVTPLTTTLSDDDMDDATAVGSPVT